MSTTHLPQNTDRVLVAKLTCGHRARIAYNTGLLRSDDHAVTCHQCPAAAPTVTVAKLMATMPAARREGLAPYEITAAYVD